MKILNLNKLIKGALLFAAGTIAAGSASASVVVASADTNLDNELRFYQNMLAGDDVFATTGWTVQNTSSVMQSTAKSFTFGTLDGSSLVGKEWFVASTTSSYSTAQLAIITSFVQNGGNVLVFGEGNGGYSAQNVIANSVLAAAGSTMTIGGPDIVSSWTSSGNNIGVNALTNGVTTLSGSYAGTVKGGNALFTANNSNGHVVIAEEVINKVPEPASLSLLLAGALGAGAVLRRRKA